MSTTITHSTGTITPTIVAGYSAKRAARSLIHEILGRSSDDVTLRPAAMRRGALTCVFAAEASAQAAVTVFSTAQVLELDDDVRNIGMSFIVADGDITIDLDDKTREVWIVTVPFSEVPG